jgi:hypothetical protein
MSRRIIIFIFIFGLAATFIFKPHAKANKVWGMPNFTVITRTPTPPPQPPTATKPPSGGNNPTAPPPENTTIPTAASTPTLIPVTLVNTPEGGFLPTAVSCGFPPTVQAQNTTYIRQGPSTAFEIIGQMVFLETRPIVGRAADAEWWIIQFSNDETGWVSNAVVKVHGNISGIPIVAAPVLNDGEQTPGPLWNPTPNPDCPVTPSATPTAIPTNTHTPKPTAAATETPPPPDTATPEDKETATTAAEEPEESLTPTATATSVVPAGAETAEAKNAVAQVGNAQPTAAPLEDSDAPITAAALPCATAMIGLAVVGFLMFRRIF